MFAGKKTAFEKSHIESVSALLQQNDTNNSLLQLPSCMQELATTL